MKKSILILNAKLINEGKIEEKDIFIENGRFSRIENDLSNLKDNIDYTIMMQKDSMPWQV